MAGLLRHRQTKGAATDRLGLRDAESCFLLYPYLTYPYLTFDPLSGYLSHPQLTPSATFQAVRLGEACPEIRVETVH